MSLEQIRRRWPELSLAGQALAGAAMIPGGGSETLAGAALVAAGAEDFARYGRTNRWQRIGQSAVVAGSTVRMAAWAANRIGPWTGSPHSAWGWERTALLAAEAACATSTAILGMAKKDTPLGRGMRTWWKWVHGDRPGMDIGGVLLGHKLGFLGAPVYWSGRDRYRHGIFVGGSGVGKTSRILAPLILQDLLRMAEGEQIGITLFEPKGEFAAEVARAARSFGIPTIHVDPSRPDTDTWNPLDGDPDKVAESVRSVLSIMFGKQDAFFSAIQGQATVSTILLLKALLGNDATLMEVQRHLLDQGRLKASVDKYGSKFRTNGEPDLTEAYFRGEVFPNDKWTQHITGLKTQLQSLLTHEQLRKVLCSPSSFSIDEHLAHGRQVLCIGSSLGPLAETLGKLFGKLLFLSFQNAVFRRPGTEKDRIPHVLVVDEAPVFLTDSIATLLSMARSYRVSVVLAMQNQSQLDLSSQGLGGQAFANTVRSNCATKLVFGTATTADDAFWVTSQFGADTVSEETIHQDSSGRRSVGTRQVEKARVRPTQVIEQKSGRAHLQLLQNEEIQVAEIMTHRVVWPWDGGPQPRWKVEASPRVQMGPGAPVEQVSVEPQPKTTPTGGAAEPRQISAASTKAPKEQPSAGTPLAPDVPLDPDDEASEEEASTPAPVEAAAPVTVETPAPAQSAAPTMSTVEAPPEPAVAPEPAPPTAVTETPKPVIQRRSVGPPPATPTVQTPSQVRVW